MRKFALALTGLVLAISGLVAIPAAAQAATAGTQTALPAATVQADGNFYAYIDINFSGGVCAWSGNSNDWGSCKNRASSVWNNGFVETIDDVLLYWGTNNSGASYCVSVGVSIANLVPVHFNRAGAGLGQSLNDNVASHRWVNGSTC